MFTPMHRCCLPLISLLAAWLATPALASDRIRMDVGNAAEIDVKDRMKTAAQALADENLDGFIDCFTAKRRPGLRRKAAMVFVKHEIDLELLDSHLVDKTARKAELTVMYRATLSQQSYDVVSLITLETEDGDWLIAAEEVQSRSGIRQRGSAAGSGEQAFQFGGGGNVMFNPLGNDLLPGNFGGGCANGRCGVPQ